MGYAVNFRLDFCDVLGNKCRVDILKKDYTGLVIPFIGSGSAFSVTYKNENDDKFNQITTSEATIGILANVNINLNTFYTEDERTWKVVYYNGSFIANNWNDLRLWNDYTAWEEYTPNVDGSEIKWVGFVMPDSSNEPFLEYPYPFQIKAKDILGTLKDIPYADNTVLIKKVDSLKNVLGECLGRTDLELNFVIGVNTFATSMDSSSVYACPLEQTYIDTNRFIDTNNKPYSVYDVIKHVCDQFTANVQQINGKWYFVDVTEKARDVYNAREYLYTTGFNKVGLVIINSSKTVLPEQLVNRDHSFEREPAYKTVSTYYEYGYLTNQINNGDFNVINPAPLLNPFPGWTAMNGLVVGYGQKSVLTGAGDVLIKNFYALIDNGGFNKSLKSDPVAVLATNQISVSVYVKMTFLRSFVDVDKARVNLILKLTAPGQPDWYWSGANNVWQSGGTGETPTNNIQFRPLGKDLMDGTTLSFAPTYPKYDGFLELYLCGVENKDSVAQGALFEDAKIALDESEYYKSAIGYVDQLVNIGKYSKSPDTTVLLFGDDAHKNRTSWMRTLNAGIFAATTAWFKKADGNANPLPLQKVVARNLLSQYRQSSRRFEGSIRGNFSPIDTLNIPLTVGRFMFVSGTYDARSAIARVVYSEVFAGLFTQFNETPFEDFGDFKGIK
jgi:hypothetical protein